MHSYEKSLLFITQEKFPSELLNLRETKCSKKSVVPQTNNLLHFVSRIYKLYKIYKFSLSNFPILPSSKVSEPPPQSYFLPAILRVSLLDPYSSLLRAELASIFL